ncbi:hypothetical protein Pmani_039144 [Petrolisthes manimaculis]|uniref:Inositol polyphosphate-related phosphatase domain-containing protein n=1 Tax=Petrolisthes manimaculis TaxID=1843537 RepID=A0AAE1NET9_9EUCA|nr:hypothetical protein Pmani_039144 [Petrolisthes manimaculis]
MMSISASSLIDRMEPASQEDGGGGRKVGLARLAKNHSLSGSLSSLQNGDGKALDEKDEPGSSRVTQRASTTPPDQQVSPLRGFGKQGSAVNLLPNKMNVSELSGQAGDRRSKSEEDTLSFDSPCHAHIPCSDPDFIRNTKSGIRPSQSLPLGEAKDVKASKGEEANSKRKDDQVSPKLKGSSAANATPKKTSPLLSRRSRLAPPQVKRSSSMTRLSEAINQIRNVCVYPAQPIPTVIQNDEVVTETRLQPQLQLSPTSVRFPEFEVNGSVPLTPLTATISRTDRTRIQSPKLARSTAFREATKENRRISSDPLLNNASLSAQVPSLKPDPESGVSLQSVSSPKCVPVTQSGSNVIENGFCNSSSPSSTKPEIISTCSKASSTSSESPGGVSITRDCHRRSTKRKIRKRSVEKCSNPLENNTVGTELKHASSVPDSLLMTGDDALCYSAPYLHSQLEHENLNRQPSWFGFKQPSTDATDAEDQEDVSLPGCRSASLDELNTLGLSYGLPIISPLDAKRKSYLFGGLNSLLGATELDRYFPNRTVSLFIATWNMNGKEPPVNLEAFLLPDDLDQMPDLFVVGTQESGGSRSEWEIRLQATIGPSHVLFTSAIFGVLHLIIYMRRDLVWFCSVPEEATYSLRPGIAYKTKGGVGIGFQFFGTRLLFICSHLTAHEEKQALRIQNFRNIVRSLDIPRLLPKRHKHKDVTYQYDSVFWLGDLNFRLAVNRDHVFEKLKNKKPDTYQHLMQWDQLSQARQKGEAFSEFEEGEINFPPTFKYDPGTDHYDTSSKQRVPSYTDRILFKSSRKAVTCTSYTSCPLFRTSDHKPVLGTFQCKIRPGKDDVPLAAGLFNREVYIEALKRRRRFFSQPSLRNCPVQ